MVFPINSLKESFSRAVLPVNALSTLIKALIFFFCSILITAGTSEAFEQWVVREKFTINEAQGRTFKQPSDLIVSEGKIIVLDSMNDRICWFDSEGRQLTVDHGSSDAPLVGSMGFTKDYKGGFFIADGYRGRILSMTTKGKPKVFINLNKEKGERPSDPTDLLFFGEKLYVVDNDNHTISIFTDDGKLEGKWGGLGEGLGRFSYPFRLAVDPRGRIGVTDVLNSRIQLFTPKGEYLSSFGQTGIVSGTLFRPGGFDIDEDGNVYIADNYFGNIQVFNISGKLLALLYDKNGDVLSLDNPVSLKVYRGNIYVVEMSANRVSIFFLER